MLHYLLGFVRFLNPALEPKSLDVATLRKRQKMFFDRGLATSAVCSVILLTAYHAGLIPRFSLIGCCLLGLPYTRAALQEMRSPRHSHPPVSLTIDVKTYFQIPGVAMGSLVFWGVMILIPSDDPIHAHKFWWSVAWFWVRWLTEWIGVLASSSLCMWMFRESFWQFITGEQWPEQPRQQKPQTSASPVKQVVHSPSASLLLPFDY